MAQSVTSLLSSLSLHPEAPPPAHLQCPYDFIIALDLEATCDENYADPSLIRVPRDKGEIIELSWAVVSVHERVIVYQSQSYVKPENTEVTPFCTQLTGITKEILDEKGDTLRKAVDTLTNFIQTHPQSAFCLITHGEWDLRYQLTRECREKGIPLPPYLGVYFDCVQEVNRVLSVVAGVPRTVGSSTLLGLSKALNIQHEGRVHSGIDDALTVARITIALLAKADAILVEKPNPQALAALRLDMPLTVPIDLARELDEFVVARSRVVKLGSVPFKTTHSQVLAFIGTIGREPEAVWMVKNAEGRSDGRGLVLFYSHEDAMAALSLNGRILGDRTVQVSPASERDLDETANIRGPFISDAELLQANAPPVMKPGDWTCPTCQFHNFAARRACSKCSTTNPSPTPFVPTQPLKPGDWICPEPTCQFQNFASRVACMRCRSSRPMDRMVNGHQHGPDGGYRGGMTGMNGNGAPGAEIRPGDWFCPQCQFHNFALRRNCGKCNLAVGVPISRNGGGMPIQTKPGDWVCPNPTCAFHNFASRAECKVCATAKPNEYHQQQPPLHVQPARIDHSQHNHAQAPLMAANTAAIAARRQYDMRPGDWICPACEAHNFASRRACIKCASTGSPHAGGGGGGYPSNMASSPQRMGGQPHYHQGGGYAPRPSMAPSKNLRPGDWLCPDPGCAFWNFRSKTVCTRCGRGSQGAQVVPEGYLGAGPGSGSGAVRRDGDWDCPVPECNFHNYASRSECHRCGVERPEDV
ncbi:hypothetical protein BDK51DRAFT_31388 [Blyttiomyces helicus]|uniref:Uncharacterized protein n=1 Tax=Blyttiomyces helicus TaxID=388810 RepID=A0A4P9WG75_9FUNG|nr:hypothetical protein BDK51DRAFT_31388 [Blyttiomyces helicus]|eukprot:RKO90905.1 hypothetical protein BDK51DRAFT_31388 [Blyttiomyces helicus]